MTSPTSDPMPATNPFEVLENIQAWGTTIMICLIVIAISCSLMAVLLVRDTIMSKKTNTARYFND